MFGHEEEIGPRGRNMSVMKNYCHEEEHFIKQANEATILPVREECLSQTADEEGAISITFAAPAGLCSPCKI